jgi:hypothetical protein
VHQLDQKEVGYGGTKQPKDEVRSAPSIEHNGEQQDDIIPESFRTHKVAYQEKGQKVEQEYIATEYHNSSNIRNCKDIKSKHSTKRNDSIFQCNTSIPHNTLRMTTHF